MKEEKDNKDHSQMSDLYIELKIWVGFKLRERLKLSHQRKQEVSENQIE